MLSRFLTVPVSWLLVGWMALGHGVLLGGDAAPSKEYQLKAAFLFNFTKFVEWPSSSFPDAEGPLVIGLYGANPFGGELEHAVQGRKVNGRSLVVKLVETPEAARATHLLFVAASQEARVTGLVRSLGDAPVLTVGESGAFLDRGGAVNFMLEDDKLRFEINMDAAERAQVRVSAQLQKLARNVRTSR